MIRGGTVNYLNKLKLISSKNRTIKKKTYVFSAAKYVGLMTLSKNMDYCTIKSAFENKNFPCFQNPRYKGLSTK